ncbi:unnamed protein product [Oikopleura dioica]|uniref:Protein-tyrosine-phosphatase n=1 Tax=Oikopleura dioica TaxID=34765 RepID=E4X1Q4_OIKDI|nr:unnamed protein product [Oikopleura dioica]CBY34146.1 unnamed protein product [Oikopleura dioica]
MKPPLMKLWTADFMKPTSFRVSLQYNIIRYKKGQINWFDKITENLYLGAIPLKTSSTSGSQGHLGDVPKKLSELNIKAVISCNEEFERAVTPSVAEWEKLGIQQYRVNVADFNFAPSVKELTSIADTINQHLSNDEGVYIHCKAGRTRSSTVMASYFIKHKRQTVDEAYSLIKKGRPHAILHDVHLAGVCGHLLSKILIT